MNPKDLIVNLIFFLGITLTVQYLFFGTSAEKPNLAERVRIMPKTDVYRPLDLEVDLWDKEFNIAPVVTKIETDFAEYTFSNEGAALIQADFKHKIGGKTTLLPGIRANGKVDRSFILAFNKKTPYCFELVSQEVLADQTQLKYKAEFDGGYLFKTFVIYQNKPQVDLNIVFDPIDASQPYRLRLIYDVPSILHAARQDQIKELQITGDHLFGLIDSYGKITKKPAAALLDRYWEDPVNFGGLDKYLVVTTINNNSSFAQRGYYNLAGNNLLKAYLESPEIDSKTEWQISFYLGPKKSDAFDKVDASLSQLLDFGFLAPLSKLFLNILNYFYGLVGNFGWAIILLTILIKLITLPLTWSMEKNSKIMAEISRKTDYLQQKYKNDPAAYARARNELMQKQGLSSIGGCLVSILIPLPVFFAFRTVLTSSIELYRAPFLWINNLVEADPWCILPLLFTICLMIRMTAKDPNPRKKINSFGMAIISGAVLAYFSAGLVLYLLVNTVLDIIQSSLYDKFGKAS